MKQIAFKHPEFNDSEPSYNGHFLNTTCRLGAKWLNVSYEERIEITDVEGNKLGHGVVKGAYARHFHNLQSHETNLQNSERTRTLAGLAEEMREVYGEQFSENSIVTMLMFAYEPIGYVKPKQQREPEVKRSPYKARPKRTESESETPKRSDSYADLVSDLAREERDK